LGINRLNLLRIIKFGILLIVFSTLISVSISFSQQASEITVFDFNNDCDINLRDAIIGLRVLSGVDTDVQWKEAADRKNPKIEIRDVIYLLQLTTLIVSPDTHCPEENFQAYEFEDNYEDDDCFRLARVIIIDNEKGPQHHTFHNEGDEDWIMFYGVQGQTYDIQAEIVEEENQCDIVIELYDMEAIQSGDALKSKDYNGEGENETLRWENCPEDEVLYVKIRNLKTEFWGEKAKYDLSVIISTAPLPGHILGDVIDKNTRQKISDVLISTSEGRSAISNFCHCYFYCARDYCIYYHPSGDCTLTATAPGYEDFSVDINVSEVIPTEQDIEMTPLP